ncbi:sirohydrochlorin cobaltochelatase [Methanospirillum hungatei]|uniref:sirohydrochlorin cobaltochelatase n=1 Tax=Methanospirillum hungatei TaxID=2203 RepID=UPI00005DF4E8
MTYIGAHKDKLVSLTIVPGIHAWIEYSGDVKNQSWQKKFESNCISVTVEAKGLGEYNLVIELFMYLRRIARLGYPNPAFQERTVRFSPQSAQVFHYPLLWA